MQYTFTYLLIHSSTYSINSLAYSLIYSITHKLIDKLTYKLKFKSIHLQTHSLANLKTQTQLTYRPTLTHKRTELLTRLLTRSQARSLILVLSTEKIVIIIMQILIRRTHIPRSYIKYPRSVTVLVNEPTLPLSP